MGTMHEIEYEILGDDMQFVKIELDPGEAIVAEAGSMIDRKSTRLNSSHPVSSRMPSSA